jgi:hypothetical protein
MARNLVSAWRLGARAAAVIVLAAALSACGQPYDEKEMEQEVIVTVQTTAGVPAVGVTVTPWILDVDVAGDSRSPIQLEPQVTDDAGHAFWTFLATDAPAICGVEIKAAAGNVLFYDAPSSTDWLSVVPGQLTVTLD